jgi:hypothetical protein
VVEHMLCKKDKVLRADKYVIGHMDSILSLWLSIYLRFLTVNNLKIADKFHKLCVYVYVYVHFFQYWR